MYAYLIPHVVLLLKVSSAFQVCSNAARVYVQKEIYAEFLEKIVRKVKQIKIGDPLNPETQMGALISEEHLQKVLGFMDIAKKEVFAFCLLLFQFHWGVLPFLVGHE